jgi:diguanylate cyclase (GGDEF)-like protein
MPVVHPRVVRHRLLSAFWWLVVCGIALTAPIYGTALFDPANWVTSGVTNILIVAAWTALCWLASRWYATAAMVAFLLGLMPLIALFTLSTATTELALNLSVSSRVALLGPLGLVGGPFAALAGLAVALASFWGYGFGQVIITGHQLVLYGIFGTLLNRLLTALEAHHDRLESVNAQLFSITLRDPATGFFNRRALEQDFTDYGAGNAIMAGQQPRLAFAMWDVDGLKHINDSLGHSAGDRHLEGFTLALRLASAPTDRLYRIGGDEFVSVHPNSDGLQDLIDRVREQFSAVSVGWVLMSDHDLDALLLETDALMYADKNMRRQNVIGQ